jgi:isopentenyl-diphosphate delta-isomerase
MKDPRQVKVAESFLDWGVPTVDAIQNIRRVAPGLLVIASGGLRGGMDIAKSIALGACLGGMAGPFLKAARQSTDSVLDLIYELETVLRTVLFATGSNDLKALQDHKLVEESRVNRYGA